MALLISNPMIFVFAMQAREEAAILTTIQIGIKRYIHSWNEVNVSFLIRIWLYL